MRYQTHLTLSEREDIMVLVRLGLSIRAIARELNRSPSTISRELARNSCVKFYRASTAQKRYYQRRLQCRRHRILDDKDLCLTVSTLIVSEKWSPEQIQGRFALEFGSSPVSTSTIYRAIYQGRLDPYIGGRKMSARLRRKGRKRRSNKENERRGRIMIPHDISERPASANARERIGDWEADTVSGTVGGACLVTLVDRRSGFLVGGKCASKSALDVSSAMIRALLRQPCLTITPDRGKEFAEHAKVTDILGAEFYFALPRHPWQRGTNENTNGLLREYFPKGKSLDNVKVRDIKMVYDKLNRRPRKRLGFRTPYEVHYGKVLHLM